ncbi:endospore germination permease [Paenibacillus sp. NEAU-GSW1]|uniref:GerAB/ArcD/ProY family transporter n=1 Tax=Paenibacillus sp. NEAU-GSW1 TaxID=2682486 RepID=UPI0012E29ED6|nr:endospore germination permease [Paenibacillus sp. NEAU-GSW1]MUT67477.1 endospore germination permease [Paenibacillus sp. NEAU-GSW1]
MEKNVRISAAQLCILMYLAPSGTGLMSSPSVAASLSGLDMWIAPIVGMLGGMLVLLVMIALHRLYPGQTLIQYAESILGRFAGKVVSIVFLFFVIYASGYVVRQLTDFLSNSFFIRTPPLFLGACIIFVCAAAVRSGMEVICRIAIMFFPFPIIMLSLIFFPLYTDFRPVGPIMENGLGPSLLGGFGLQLWYSIFCYSTFYLPYVNRPQKLIGWSLLSPLLLTLLLSITNWHIISKLGNSTIMYNYPFLAITRFISFSEFFEHLESVVMMVWVVAFALRLIYGYYCAAIGIAQWLNLPDYRPIVLPLGMLILTISIWNLETSQFGQTKDLVFPTFYIVCGLGIPLFLLLAAWLRKAFESGSKQQEQQPIAQEENQA